MIGISDFLRERIAEDDAVARVAQVSGPPIHVGEPWDTGYVFASRHTPTRVLGECEAKRRIVEQVDFVLRQDERTPREEFTSRHVLEMLALSYAGHPDYREEWRP